MFPSSAFKTPIAMKIFLAKAPEYDSTFFQEFSRVMLENACAQNKLHLQHALNLLKFDLSTIHKYRDSESDPVNGETFRKWFPNIGNADIDVLSWLDTDRDFIYSSHGMRLLKNRYLLPAEPIQYCMLRIAKLFSRRNSSNNSSSSSDGNSIDDINFQLWRLMYDVLSCGYMHTSSILADADNADKNIVPGEACRLLVCNPDYDRAFVNQINEICNLISLGVGVGMSASTVPLHGYAVNGKIRGGFKSFARKLDSCNYLSIYERKPKIAIYIEMHNDTIYEAFELRNPLTNHLENVFVGIMVPDYFIECYENDEDWYLFPGDAKLDGRTLCEFTGDEYKRMYKRFVEANLYTNKVSSSALMDDLVTCISETGSPYVVWSDNVNRFSNHKHLGKIKTLNLCAEIANYASVGKSSSCTLMSVNFAMYREFPDVLDRVYAFVEEHSEFDAGYNGFHRAASEFQHATMSKYAYAMGFVATWALNMFMGVTRKQRELGVSPLGAYDMAIMDGVDPVKVIAELSEAMYKGCIYSSCKFARMYDVECAYYKGSPFSEGIPQWLLRDERKIITTDWTKTCELMRTKMANSQLTAQAPTATTSMLVGEAESVTIPMSIVMARESENGRNDLICYGLLYKLLMEPAEPLHLDNDIDRQLLMYARSAPFIDQSQSTMFSIVLSRQNILNLIMDTYYLKLKTAIYYTLPKQINNTLTIVRQTPQPQKRESSTDCQFSPKRSRRPSCEACSA
nr:RR1 protein [Oryctes rhinoceros nudivirus]